MKSMSEIKSTPRIVVLREAKEEGWAEVELLSSKDAKKVYTGCTAAALRAKDCVMKTATTVQENAEDILAEAKQVNEKRDAEKAAAVEEE